MPSLLDPSSPSVAPQRLEGSPYTRFEMRSTSIRGLMERVNLLASGQGMVKGDTKN
jgi:hypothetical protein